MGEVSTVGLDIAKSIFQAHGADAAGEVVFRKKLGRGRLLSFFADLPPCVVALEACAGGHHWGRELARLGHTVRLIPPAYVKPFVKRLRKLQEDGLLTEIAVPGKHIYTYALQGKQQPTRLPYPKGHNS